MHETHIAVNEKAGKQKIEKKKQFTKENLRRG